MATASGGPGAVVTDLQRMLNEEPFQVHFFQAVRLLQQLEKDCKPVGYFNSPQDETIRFSSRTWP